jgi:seryl-tRNA synthetase
MYEKFTIPSSDAKSKVLRRINSDPYSNSYKQNDSRVLIDVLRKIDKKWKAVLAKKDKLVSKMSNSAKNLAISKEIASIRAAQDEKKAALKKALNSKSSNVLKHEQHIKQYAARSIIKRVQILR